MSEIDLDLSAVKGSVVIIPAAGVGKRFGGDKPKQYNKINGKTILDTTLNVFISSDSIDRIILVLSPEDEYVDSLAALDNDKIIIIDGGNERSLSVNNGLRYLFDNGLPDKTPLLVHDAVRPCLSHDDLQTLLDFYQQQHKACFLAEKIVDSIKKINLDSEVSGAMDRDNIILAQTPQLASFIEMKTAYSSTLKAGIDVTDEVGVLANCDIPVFAVFSKDANIKITRPNDLIMVEHILNARTSNH